MPAPLTYATAHAYLLGLGTRFANIGQSELSYSGEPTLGFPVLLVEGDTQANEINPGLETFTVAVQVLTQADRVDTEVIRGLLEQTNGWADQLTEQIHQERPGQLASVSKLALPAVAGGSLATGWRLELQLKLAKDLDRQTNPTLFEPEA